MRFATCSLSALLTLAGLAGAAQAAPIAVPKNASKTMRTLLSGIDSAQSKDAKLTRLMANLKKISFNYTGSGSASWEQYLTGTGQTRNPGGTLMRTPWGDCGTVVNMFLKVAKNQLGIDTLVKKDIRERFWTEGAPIVDPKYKRGNVMGKYWFWASHVWAVDTATGKVYDALFNKTYPSEEKMKATVWHMIEQSMMQNFKIGAKSYPKYVVKPTLTIYQNPNPRAPAWQKYLTTPPKGVAAGGGATATKRGGGAAKKGGAKASKSREE